MLNRLTIRNLALVEQIDLEFGPGLNVITGETGAGKSILIGAIALALGDRARAEIARDKTATVESTFQNDNETVTLKREIKPNGRSSAWINTSPATITALRQEAENWVDLTAQREGITLLDPQTHLVHLDRYANLTADVAALELQYTRWQALQAELASIIAQLRRMKETDELAGFQREEIERFDPQEGEDTELDIEIRKLESAESLLIGLSGAVEALDQGDNPLSDAIAKIASEIRSLSKIDPSLQDPAETLEQTVELLRTTSQDMLSSRDSVILDPERLEELRDRRGQLSRLIRKYGGSMQALFEFRENLQKRESGVAELNQNKRKIEEKTSEHLVKWEKELESVSSRRKKAAPKLIEEMQKGLRTVGVEHPQFAIEWSDAEGDSITFPGGIRKVNSRGWDHGEFQISFNPGQPLRPIQSVASGGELSRVMLLLKGIHPPEKMPPVLIFDEVDTGISGKTARQVGLRLRELSRVRQVLLVTHLPQIASLADRHWVIGKQVYNDSTVVHASNVMIGSKEQVEEIARLVGGELITDNARATARELIESRE